ncbi:MAG: ribonuclease Z [Clostridia bacterium]|nr:ribonuclease Z [Clostridia bacterium]
MTVICCIEERGGLSFGGRRVSRDKAVTEDIVRSLNGATLRLSAKSAPLFDGLCEPVVSDLFLEEAAFGDVCFVEDRDPTPFLSRAGRVILYRWNRRYPFDLRLDETALFGFHLIGQTEFSGTSHERITREIFER